MTDRKGILTGGTWCVDHNLLIDGWPDEEGLAHILSASTNGGGPGCNMAIDIKRLDEALPVATITLLGDDADGHFLKTEAERFGIDCTQMQFTHEATTNYTHAYASNETGRRTHFGYFGASHLLSPDHFDFSDSAHRYFHLGHPGIHKLMDGPTHGDDNGWVTVLRRARTAGLRTNLELASLPANVMAALVRPCLPHLDVLIVNDSEIAGIAGFAANSVMGVDPRTCIEAAKRVMGMGNPEHIAVHFPLGGIVVSRDGSVVTHPSANVPPDQIRGANGAGDAFAAGFLYGLHEDWSPERALILANAVAAASLRDISTSATVESVTGCLRLAERWGWRDSLT